MSRLCMRSRCDRPAQVRLTYDTLCCRVYFDDLPEAHGMYQEICEYHALRLKLPIGWELSDRRGLTPTLFDLEALVRMPKRRSSGVTEPVVTRTGAVGTERIDLVDRRPTSRHDHVKVEDTVIVSSARVVERVIDDVLGHRSPRRSGGLRSAEARSSRTRRPLPTPSEMFGVDRLPGVDIRADRDDSAIAVVSLGDRSIETVIVLGPEDRPGGPPRR